MLPCLQTQFCARQFLSYLLLTLLLYFLLIFYLHRFSLLLDLPSVYPRFTLRFSFLGLIYSSYHLLLLTIKQQKQHYTSHNVLTKLVDSNARYYKTKKFTSLFMISDVCLTKDVRIYSVQDIYFGGASNEVWV